jgi:hypothetical protein
MLYGPLRLLSLQIRRLPDVQATDVYARANARSYDTIHVLQEGTPADLEQF